MGFKNIFSNRVAKFFLLLGIIMVLGFIASDFVGFSRTGFEDPSVIATRNFYIGIGSASAITLIILFLYSIARKEGDKEYGRGIGFASLGETPHLKFFGRFTNVQIFFLFTILFLISGALNISGIFGAQKTYTGVGALNIEQQFTPADSALYSSLLTPIAENLPLATVLAFVSVLFGMLARKYKMNKGLFVGLFIILFIVFGAAYGIGQHNLRYQASDVALQTVGIFWAIGGFLTAITGAFLPFWIMHIVNNLYFDLSRFMSVEAILGFTAITLLILIPSYLFIYRGRLLGEKKIQNE